MKHSENGTKIVQAKIEEICDEHVVLVEDIFSRGDIAQAKVVEQFDEIDKTMTRVKKDLDDRLKRRPRRDGSKDEEDEEDDEGDSESE